MPIRAELIPPRSPMIRLPRDDEGTLDDRRAFHALRMNVGALSNHSELFTSCAALLECSDQNEFEGLSSQWSDIAFREGLVCLYNFGEALKGMDRNRRQSKMIAGRVDNQLLDDTRAEFRAQFPHVRELRQTILHDAERHNTPDRAESNAARGAKLFDNLEISPVVMIMGGFMRRGPQYSSNHDGKMVHYELSAKSAASLVVMVRAVHASLGDLVL